MGKSKSKKPSMFNYQTMKTVCTSPIHSFVKYGKVTNTTTGIYIFKPDFNPNAKRQALNSRILAVAHLDTVLDLSHFYKLIIDESTCILNVNLDDRLGAYILLDVLPRLGLQYDLLLTEGEESGQSTAQWFEPPVDYKYNWMFSFDRHGTDVVSYQYDAPILRERLKECKLNMAIGSYSDISYMDGLGCRGINIGTGYHDEHTDMCHAFMWQTRMNINKFVKFYHLNKGTHYPYTWTPHVKKITNRWPGFSSHAGNEWVDLPDDDDVTAEDDLGRGYNDKFVGQAKNNWCMDCGNLVTDANRSSLDPGLCRACEADIVGCVVCGGLYPYYQLSNEGLCDVCEGKMENRRGLLGGDDRSW